MDKNKIFLTLAFIALVAVVIFKVAPAVAVTTTVGESDLPTAANSNEGAEWLFYNTQNALAPPVLNFRPNLVQGLENQVSHPRAVSLGSFDGCGCTKDHG